MDPTNARCSSRQAWQLVNRLLAAAGRSQKWPTLGYLPFLKDDQRQATNHNEAATIMQEHFAKVEAGVISTVEDAFNKYLATPTNDVTELHADHVPTWQSTLTDITHAKTHKVPA